MSKKIVDIPELQNHPDHWRALLEQIRAEDRASDDLTEEEKRLLDEMDNLSDEEWEPIICEGEPVSETIIKERGER